MIQIFKNIISVRKSASAIFWLLVWLIYMVVIFILDTKSFGDAKSVKYIVIASAFLVSIAIYSQLKMIRFKEKLSEKLKDEKDLKSKIDRLESKVKSRTEKIDKINEELSSKSSEYAEISRKLRDHRDELGNIVRERTSELENLTNEMSESQKALIYLVEDVNDSRSELEDLNRKMNRALKESESSRNKIDGILRSVADGLIVTDFEKKIVLINHIAEEIFNISSKKAIGKYLDDIIDVGRFTKDPTSMSPEILKTSNFDFEKSKRIFNAKVSAIWGNTGLVTGMIIIFRDVTHERELDAAKSEFISTSAHELRTPLTSIRGFSEILLTKSNLKEDEKKKFLEYINHQAITLGNIINDLLDISRIESGDSYKVNRTEFNPGEMIEDTIMQFRELTGGHSFKIVNENKSKMIYADRELLIQALTNLVNNSVKYSPNGGEITISLRFNKSGFIFIVSDQGLGMTSAQIEQIFEKFYRADSTNTAVEGTGLGMSIVKNIIEAHDGTINIKSELDAGTIVTFTIPQSGQIKNKKEKVYNRNNK